MDTPFTKHENHDVDAAAERIRKLNEQILGTARESGLAWLDVYEKTLKSVADMQQSAGEASHVQWFSGMAAAQANFTREMAETYASAARQLVKA